MPKLSPGDLRALLVAQKADALSAMSASKLSDARSRALDYYLGHMTRDMPAPEGALQGGVDRRRRYHRRADADLDGHLLRRPVPRWKRSIGGMLPR